MKQVAVTGSTHPAVRRVASSTSTMQIAPSAMSRVVGSAAR
jgi:hypothetical protein